MIRPRRILYVTGTRADFGLLRTTLEAIHADQRFDLQIAVTGMHLDPLYGETVTEIEQAGLSICARVPVSSGTSSGALMATNIGRMIAGFVSAFEKAQPDLVLLLGDRGEMLAGAIAALHLAIPIAHIHGGERSGTVDEPVRHAVSKLSNLHLVSTEQSRERLVRMGEEPGTVHVVGAPGIDGLATLPVRGRAELAAAYQLDAGRPWALLVYHPVGHEADHVASHVETILACLKQANAQVIALKPNSDAGSASIRKALEQADGGDVRVFTHLARQEFSEFMAVADVMIGNSSSGIIEAATFGTRVVNIGSRQNLRERSGNVIDLPVDAAAISDGIMTALNAGRFTEANVYGDGHATGRIVELLATVDLASFAKGKTNAY